MIISFPQAHDYVFWERSSYTPWWDVSGVGVCYEFVECWGYGNMGCSEPMQDKENRFSRVRIVENSPARVVIHWRYALTDPNYRIFRDEWVDEYYYLYPDAVGVRQVNLWANSDLTHEFIQPQYVMPPGVLPAQVFERQPCRVFNLAGESVVDDMDLAGPDKPRQVDCDQWTEGVMRIRLKDRSHPFYAWVRRDDLFPRIDRIFPPWQPPVGDVRYNFGTPLAHQAVERGCLQHRFNPPGLPHVVRVHQRQSGSGSGAEYLGPPHRDHRPRRRIPFRCRSIVGLSGGACHSRTRLAKWWIRLPPAGLRCGG